MGQAGNSKRHASLDDQKERAAGRNSAREVIKNEVMPREMKGRAGGAFGAQGKANRGGGTAAAAPRAAREAGRSTKSARKRKA